MTAGAATPFFIAGMGVGFIGAGTNIAGNIKESLTNSKEINKADSDLKEALDSIKNVKGIIPRVVGSQRDTHTAQNVQAG